MLTCACVRQTDYRSNLVLHFQAKPAVAADPFESLPFKGLADRLGEAFMPVMKVRGRGHNIPAARARHQRFVLCVPKMLPGAAHKPLKCPASGLITSLSVLRSETFKPCGQGRLLQRASSPAPSPDAGLMSFMLHHRRCARRSGRRGCGPRRRPRNLRSRRCPSRTSFPSPAGASDKHSIPIGGLRLDCFCRLLLLVSSSWLAKGW